MPETIDTLRQNLVLFLPQFVVSILIFLVFWIVSRIVRRIIHGVGTSAKLDAEVRELLEDIAGIAIVVFGLITALGTVGINVTALVAGLGLTGFALGFALQDIIANTLAGILILFYKPFKVGDYITVAGHDGAVADIDLRYTTLHGDTEWILIPNQTLFKEAIKVVQPGGQPADPDAKQAWGGAKMAEKARDGNGKTESAVPEPSMSDGKLNPPELPTVPEDGR